MARPRKLDLDQLRAEIIAAAREMLRTRDLPDLTARALAQSLSIPASAIYRIFPTMGEVVMAVNQATFAELEALFERLPEGGAAEERVLGLAANYLAFMRANPNLWRALFGGPKRAEAYPEWYLAAISGLMGRLAALLESVAPHLGPARAAELAARLYVLAHGALSLEIDGRLSMMTPLPGDEIVLGAVRSLLAGLAAPPGSGRAA